MSKFSRFFGRSPETLTPEDVRTHQVQLASNGVAWASLNQAVAALGFLYCVTLGMAEFPERIAYAREPRRLPAVLSAEEVVRFLSPDRAAGAAHGLPVGAGGVGDRQEGDRPYPAAPASPRIRWRAGSTSA